MKTMTKIKKRDGYNYEGWRDFAGKVHDRIVNVETDKTKTIEINGYKCITNQAGLWDWEAYVKSVIMPQYDKPDWEYKLTYYADSIIRPDIVTWYNSYKNKQNVSLFKLDPYRLIWVDINKDIEPMPEFPVDIPAGQHSYEYIFGEITKVAGKPFHVIRFADQKVKTDDNGLAAWRAYVSDFIKQNYGKRGIARPLPLEWAAKTKGYNIEVL
jgi:hypothetical protein